MIWRKIDRHRANVAAMGPRLCARQHEVTDEGDLVQEIWREANRYRCPGPIGIRTDWPIGASPQEGDLGKLPFAACMAGRTAWEMGVRCLRRGLTVLVCETFAPLTCAANFAAARIDADTTLIAHSTARTTQRDIGQDPAQVQHLYVSESRSAVVGESPVLCYHPEELRHRHRLDLVHAARLLLPYPGEVSASWISPPGRLVFW